MGPPSEAERVGRLWTGEEKTATERMLEFAPRRAAMATNSKDEENSWGNIIVNGGYLSRPYSASTVGDSAPLNSSCVEKQMGYWVEILLEGFSLASGWSP